jgi:hypothetical protein
LGFELTPLLKLSTGWLALCMLVAVTGIYRNNFWVDQILAGIMARALAHKSKA